MSDQTPGPPPPDFWDDAIAPAPRAAITLTLAEFSALSLSVAQRLTRLERGTDVDVHEPDDFEKTIEQLERLHAELKAASDGLFRRMWTAAHSPWGDGL